MKVVWVTRKHCVEQRTVVCSRDNKGVKWYVRDQNKAVNIILSTNRWVDGENEPGTGTVSEILCRLQAKELAIIVSISRVHN